MCDTERMAEKTTPPNQVKTETAATKPAEPTSGTSAAVETNPLTPEQAMDFDNLTVEQQDAILYGSGIPVSAPAKSEETTAPATAETPAGEKPQEAAQPESPKETPATEETPATPTATPEATATEPAQKPEEAAAEKEFRPRLTDLPEIDREAIVLRRDLMKQGKDIPLEECVARVKAKYNVPSSTPAEPPVDPAFTALEKEIEGLITELGQAQEGVLATPDLLEKAATLGQKRAELSAMKNRRIELAQEIQAHAEQAAQQTWQQARSKSREQAIADYPDVVKKDSPLAKRVQELIDERTPEDHPDHASLQAQNAPLDLVRIAAAELGIPKATAAAKAAPVVPAQSQAQPHVKVNPASGAQRTTPPTPQQSEAQLLDKLDKGELSDAEIDRLLYGGKKPMAVIA